MLPSLPPSPMEPAQQAASRPPAATPLPPLSFSWSQFALIVGGALLLTWPAIYNHYPLLYPDSITYLADGRRVARALFLHQFSKYYGMRSLIYSLGILPFHWNVTPWPVVGLNALLIAWVVWLVVRSVFPERAVASYLLLVPLLSLLTSCSWYSSLILPDILGPLLYLAIYLLVFARDSLSRREKWALALLAAWAAASHLAHLILASGVCLLFALLSLLRCPPLAGRMRVIADAAVVIVVAAAAQLALHAYLYGQPSLSGDSPPFLAARVIADGPGRWYLEQHCPQVQLTLCDSVDRLPGNTDDFLWKPGGIWYSAVRAHDMRIRQQAIPFVLAVVREYPREELLIAARNFWQQLGAFGVFDFDRNDWVLSAFDAALPGDKQHYANSWQANDDLPLDFFSTVQYWVVIASLAAIAYFAVFRWRRLPVQLVGLSLAILPVVVANAIVTGVFSNVEERYQSRVIWLLPLLALLFGLNSGVRSVRPGSEH